MGDLEGLNPVGPTFRKEGKAGEVEGGNGVRFGIGTVEVVGVDELEESLVVEEFGEGVVRVRVWKLKAGGFPCAGMVKTGESADGVGYGTPWLLNDDL